MSGKAANRGTVYSSSDNYIITLVTEIDPFSVIVGGLSNESWNVLKEFDDGLRGDQSNIRGGRTERLR